VLKLKNLNQKPSRASQSRVAFEHLLLDSLKIISSSVRFKLAGIIVEQNKGCQHDSIDSIRSSEVRW